MCVVNYDQPQCTLLLALLLLYSEKKINAKDSTAKKCDWNKWRVRWHEREVVFTGHHPEREPVLRLLEWETESGHRAWKTFPGHPAPLLVFLPYWKSISVRPEEITVTICLFRDRIIIAGVWPKTVWCFTPNTHHGFLIKSFNELMAFRDFKK